MADPKKINIDIVTTADTSGVEKADDAVKKFNGTVSVSTVDQFLDSSASKARVAEFAFYDLEKEIAKTGNSGEKLTPLVGAIRRVETVSKQGADGVKNLGGFVNQAGFQVTDFAVQVQGGTSAITAFSQQFPQLIGSVQQSGFELGKIQGGLANLPIGIGTAISIGAVAVGVGVSLAVAAYDKMKAAEKSLADARKRNADLQVSIAQGQIKLQNQIREEFILSIYQKQADELERQEKALERMNVLRGAQGSAAEAQANAAVTVAQNTGGDVVGAQANALAVSVENRSDEIQGQLQAAEQVAARAAEDLAKANSLLGEFRSRNDEFSDEFKNASANFDKAATANENAQLDLTLQQQKYDAALQGINANTEASLSTLTTEANAAQVQAAQDTLAALQAKSAEVGGDLSSNAKQAVTDLAAILRDGVIKPEEMALLRDAMNQIRASREGADQQILTGLNSLQSTTDTVLKTLPGVLDRIRSLERAAASWTNRATQ